MEATSLEVPARPSREAKAAVVISAITDEYIYRTVARDLEADVFSLTRSVRSSTTDDRLRGIIAEFLKTQIGNLDFFIRYGKAKSWRDSMPAFKTGRDVRREQLSVAEAYHLWDHLAMRYVRLQLTEFFASLAAGRRPWRTSSPTE